MDYFEFEKYFKKVYNTDKALWSMDDIDVVDYAGLWHDAKTLFHASLNDVDINHNILNPEDFAKKIYDKFCERYTKEFFDMYLKGKAVNFSGPYAEIAKISKMTLPCNNGWALFFGEYTKEERGSLSYGFAPDFYIRIYTDEEFENFLYDKIGLGNIYFYRDNRDVLLLDSYRQKYLTDIDTLSKYLDLSTSELYSELFSHIDETEKQVKEKVSIITDALESLRCEVITYKYEPGENYFNVLFKILSKPECGILTLTVGYYDSSVKIMNEDSKYFNDKLHFVKDVFYFHDIEECLSYLSKFIYK